MYPGKIKQSIRYKFFRDITVVLIISACVLSVIIAMNEWQTLRHTLMTKGNSFASYIASLSQDPLIMRDGIQLDYLVKEVNKDEDILYCFIEDAQGQIVTSQYASINYQSQRLREILSDLPKSNELQDVITTVKRSGAVAKLSLPIYTCTDMIGRVNIAMSEDSIRKQLYSRFFLSYR